LIDVLSAGSCKGIYKAFGTIVDGIRPPPPSSKRLQHAQEGMESAMTYEVQVRGVRQALPTIVLRMLRKDVSLLPTEWGSLKEVALWPSYLCTART